MFFKKEKSIEEEFNLMPYYWRKIGYGTRVETKYKMLIQTINTCFEFNKENKTIRKLINPLASNEKYYITYEELQAINKQVEELGWK